MFCIGGDIMGKFKAFCRHKLAKVVTEIANVVRSVALAVTAVVGMMAVFA